MLTAGTLIGAIAAISTLIAHPGQGNAFAGAALAAVLFGRTGACLYNTDKHTYTYTYFTIIYHIYKLGEGS